MKPDGPGGHPRPDPNECAQLARPSAPPPRAHCLRNRCGERIRLARALHRPPLSQQELAVRLQLHGYDLTPLMISRIETHRRYILDTELYAIAQVLDVPPLWLLGDPDAALPTGR